MLPMLEIRAIRPVRPRPTLADSFVRVMEEAARG
jgi:hypothetical protein